MLVILDHFRSQFFNSFETVNEMQGIVKNLSYQELSNSNY